MPDASQSTTSARFRDSLEVKLALSIGEDTFEYTAGSVDHFTVDLRAWGFEAQVSFHISAEQEDDPLLDAFTSSAPIGVTLSFTREIQGEDEPARPTIRGLVVTRSVVEVMGSGILGAPPVRRQYDLRFRDPAAVLWQSHWPVELFVRASMASVLDAQKVGGIELELDWSELDTQRPMICLPLSSDGGVSFYDFLVWWIASHGGVLEYDGASGSYRIAAKKRALKQSVEVEQEIVSTLRLDYPEPPRFTSRIRNARAVDPTTDEIDQPTATKGVYRDVLLRDPLASSARSRADAEALRQRYAEFELKATFSRCPSVLQNPGSSFSLGEGFSTKSRAYGRKFRLVELRLDALQATPDDNEEEDTTVVYDASLHYVAEIDSSTAPRLPAYASGDLQVHVEGTIVSVGGLDTDRTWTATDNEDDSLWTYKVFIPAYNKEVACPFKPLYTSGHFFFPAYKHQRVLVALHWDRAEIVGFLDWSDEGRLPIDSQGNQIVMGPKLGNGTVIRHSYIDTKPVLRVERKTPEETQIITVADGVIRISLEEEKMPPTSLPTFDVSLQVEAARDQVSGKVQGGITEVTAQYQASSGALSSAIDTAGAEVDAQLSATEQKVFAELDASEARLQTLGNELSGSTAQVAAQSSAAQAQVRAATPDASGPRARISAARSAAQAQLTAQGQTGAALSSALRPFDQALLTLEGADREAKALIDGALAALQGAESALMANARGAESAARAVIDGASDALAGVRRGVAAVGEIVRAPLAVLDELIPKIQIPFKTASNTLSEVVARTDAVLGAIKASGLPKELVQPAISAIQAATNTLLPPLDPMIKQGVSQLEALGQTLTQQVATAQRAALQVLSAQQAQLSETIQATVAPLEAQLNAARTAVEQATAAYTQATQRLTSEAVAGLNAVKARIDALG